MTSLARRALSVAPAWLIAVALWVPALWQLKLLVGLYLSRVSYPFDVEWLESSALYQAYRHMTGQSTYAPPSHGYLPLFHPPGYPMLLAAVGKIAGLGYATARTVSMAFFALSAALGVRCLLVHERERHDGRRAEPSDARSGSVHGVTAGVLAVGVAASSTPLFEGFYDLVREDCMAWSLCVVGAVLGEARKPTTLRLVALALCTTLAAYTRILTVFLLAWIHLFVLARNRRAGVQLALYSITACALALVGLQLQSKGWYWLYTVGLLHDHMVITKRLFEGTDRVLKFLPFLWGMPVAVLVLAVPGRLSARAVLWCGLVVASIPAALLPFAKVGGFANDFMPFAMVSGPAALLLVADAARGLQRWPRGGLALRYTCYVALAALLGLKSWHKDFCWERELARYTPTPEHWRRARALNALVVSMDGGTISPRHPFLAIHNGHRNPQFSDMPILDAYWSGMPGLSLGAYLDKSRARWALLSGNEQNYTLGEMASRYQFAEHLTAMPGMLIGEYSRFGYLFRWQDPEDNLRVVFDFEDTEMAGWQRTGDAWTASPTTARPRAQSPLFGVVGARAANSYFPASIRGGDARTGVLSSPPFFIDRTHLAFRIGGGGSGTWVELLVGGRTVFQQRPIYPERELLLKVVWEVKHLQGHEAVLRLVDDDSGSWGHLLCDHVVLYDAPSR